MDYGSVLTDIEKLQLARWRYSVELEKDRKRQEELSKLISKNSALRTKITQAKIRSIERGYEKEKNKDLTRNKEQLEKENKKLEAIFNTILNG